MGCGGQSVMTFLVWMMLEWHVDSLATQMSCPGKTASRMPMQMAQLESTVYSVMVMKIAS